MKKTIALIAALMWFTLIHAQNLQTIRTYYDPYYKTHLYESYTVIAGTPTKQGLYRQYDEKGLLVKEMTYIRGERNGINKEYYSSDYDHDSRGKLGLMCNYKNDDLEGVYEEYQYPNGIKWTKMTDIYKNGKVLKSTRYFLNGKPETITEKDGTDYEFFENGQKSTQLNHKTGEYISWYKDGKIAGKGKYVGKLKVGDWVYYDTLGHFLGRNRYSDSLIYISSANYFSDGKLKDTIYRVHGQDYLMNAFDSLGNKVCVAEAFLENQTDGDLKFNGHYLEYYPSGKIKKDCYYKMDQNEGSFKSYFENGKIQTVGEYTKGRTINLWKTYEENGEIKSAHKYNEYGYEIGIPQTDLTPEEITKLGFKYD